MSRRPARTYTLSRDAEAYYEGGRRVMVDGVPCRMAARRPDPRTAALKLIMPFVLAGETEWTPIPNLRRFTYTPPETAEPIERRRTSWPPPCSPAVKKSYYAGGVRVVVGGVPMRRARKPGKAYRAMVEKFG